MNQKSRRGNQNSVTMIRIRYELAVLDLEKSFNTTDCLSFSTTLYEKCKRFYSTVSEILEMGVFINVLTKIANNRGVMSATINQ